MKKLGIILLCWLGCFSAGAQSPVVSTSVNKTTILIGEQLELTLRCSFAPEKYKAGLFEVPSKIEHFTIVSTGNPDTVGADGYVTLTQKWILTSFDSGRHTIPAFQVRVQQAGNQPSVTMYSDPVAIQVNFSPPDSVMPFHDIKPIIEAPEAKTNRWLWIGLIAVALMLAFAGIFWWLKKRRPKKVLANDTPVAPYEEAVNSLRQLKNEQLLQKGAMDEFHLRLTNIFRRYVARSYQKLALSMTTSDLLIFLSDRGGRDHISRWSNSLLLSDAVKFARFKPTISQSEEVFRETENIIHTLQQTQKMPKSDS